uniref:Odorant receptor n=1 Tax=Colaphellus bowringi TaxID=561076 RepID=A0A0S3J3F5_9CUCU|nr:odorant receptor OR15 [Colaphellus bowringi]
MKEVHFKNTVLNFYEFYNTDFKLLKFFGIWIPDSSNSKFHKIYFIVINFVFCAIFNLAQVSNLLHEINNLKNLAACGYVVAIACMANVRSYYFLKNREEFLYLIRSLNDSHFQPESEDQICSAKKSLRFYSKVKMIVSILCTITVFISMSTPVFYKKNELNLPFASWYPFDVSSYPIYQIAYVHQCISVIYVTSINTYVDIIMAGFNTFIGIQCDLLCSRLYNISKDHSSEENETTLLDCIRHHKLIVRFANNTEILFNRIYLGQFIACTSALCMALFLLTLHQESRFESSFLVFYLTAIFSLLFIPCWFSSEMQGKSENIPEAAYSCNWVTASKLFKKDLIFFILRAQKPLKFYAVGFFQISVETFVLIVRSSFSYYTVLNNMIMKEG